MLDGLTKQAHSEEGRRAMTSESHIAALRSLKTSPYFEVARRARKLLAILGDADPAEYARHFVVLEFLHCPRQFHFWFQLEVVV
jgi:hypothetical protein